MVAATYKILLEQTPDGQSSATVLELPNCQVTAMAPQPRNPWAKFAGMFQNDPDFAEIAQALRAERTATEDEI